MIIVYEVSDIPETVAPETQVPEGAVPETVAPETLTEKKEQDNDNDLYLILGSVAVIVMVILIVWNRRRTIPIACCPYCKSRIRPDDTFCSNCGNALKELKDDTQFY